MAFNSFRRRGSRSVVHASLNTSPARGPEDSDYHDIDHIDVHVLKFPEQRSGNTISDDSKNAPSEELRSEELAILSSSSDDDSCPHLSNSQRIDAWSLQSELSPSGNATHIPVNARVQDIVKSWGVDHDIPFVEAQPQPWQACHDLPNVTFHRLAALTPAQLSQVKAFVQDMLAHLRRSRQRYRYRFKSVPSVFPERDLLWKLSLSNAQVSAVESIYQQVKSLLLNSGCSDDGRGDSSNNSNGASRASRANHDDDGDGDNNDNSHEDSLRAPSPASRSSAMDSWYGWNVVPRLRDRDL